MQYLGIEAALKNQPLLDPAFIPFGVWRREYEKEASRPFALAVERDHGAVSVFETKLRGEDFAEANYRYIERFVKLLLWSAGGLRVWLCGDDALAKRLQAEYCPDGRRAFDVGFMQDVFEVPFEIVICDWAHLPKPNEKPIRVGGHTNGCRIGFDAGGSDRKVSAVIDGEAVYSEEVVWFPKTNSDPKYHYDGILQAMKTAASHMPRVDGIGVSSAGVYIDNRIMIASLFLKVSDEDFEKHVKNMYLDVAKEIGENIPVEVANDGDVTALAGAMDLDDDSVLGVAMGTSEAGGYVDEQGNITGWLNELAFVPADFCKDAMVDEWSGDYGCGVKYFSQDAVIKLAPAAGIELDESLSPAEKLKVVQKLMAEGDERAAKIYETIGVYFGYAIAFYAEFYKIKHVLIMGRVTSGEGGVILLKKAQEVLDTEFPQLASTMELHIPDESSRRVGQSVAAASLPKIK